MAEILVFAKSGGSYQPGDIVEVRPDGFYNPGGRLETRTGWIAGGGLAAEWPANFFLLRLPGVSVEKVKHLKDEWTDTDGTRRARRLWRLVLDELTAAQRSALLAKGEFTVGVDMTRAQMEARLREKLTEGTATLAP